MIETSESFTGSKRRQFVDNLEAIQTLLFSKVVILLAAYVAVTALLKLSNFSAQTIDILGYVDSITFNFFLGLNVWKQRNIYVTTIRIIAVSNELKKDKDYVLRTCHKLKCCGVIYIAVTIVTAIIVSITI